MSGQTGSLYSTPGSSSNPTPEILAEPTPSISDSASSSEPAPTPLTSENQDAAPLESPVSPALEDSPTSSPIATPLDTAAETSANGQEFVPVSANVSAPLLIHIPALDINADIESVGLTEERAMDVPKDWLNVGWYELGFGPGQFGNMVMTGHVDSPRSDNGIFNELDQLEVGDRIYLQAEDGTRYGYIVESYQYYEYDDAPMEEIFGYASEPRLNLITCRGSWDRGEDTYDQRLVVFTRQTHSVEPDNLESEEPLVILPEEN